MKKIILRVILLLLLVIIAIVSLLIGTGYSMYAKAIKQISLEDKINEIQSNENYTKIDDMTEIYKNAVVAVEDHRFYKHNGVDILSIFRAIGRNVKAGELQEGGSTITQQLAKNTYFTQNKELTRKIAEGFMAFKYEKELEKNEILELYVNTSYFGDGYYNIKEASLGYFNKLPSELNNYESTMLAGIPNAPSVYSPTVNFELASQRQNQVLTKMVEYGYISEEEKNEILIQKDDYQVYFNNKK